jgi:hypothetical protein
MPSSRDHLTDRRLVAPDRAVTIALGAEQAPGRALELCWVGRLACVSRRLSAGLCKSAGNRREPA